MMDDDDYRAAARQLMASVKQQIGVGIHAHVQRLADGGAFVEATIFVPEDAMKENGKQRAS